MSMVLDTGFHIWFYFQLITKCDRSLLQNATVITNYDGFITKFDVYHRVRQCMRERHLFFQFTIYFIRKHLRITEQYRPIERAILPKPKIHWLFLSLLMLFHC